MEGTKISRHHFRIAEKIEKILPGEFVKALSDAGEKVTLGVSQSSLQ